MSMNNRTVIVITGPTASGKTSLGVSLALALGTEVVSADSMQLYRGMDIGSAKPTREEMRGVPHQMIDVADPAEDYSVSRWVENAAACCDALLAGGKTPVIVGGTGLYIESLLSGRDFSAAPGDFAKTVLMPGDPLRAKFIAETFLENPRLVTDVRGMLGYTGTYQGHPVSVMGSGMGMPSIGIYSYELYSQYGVENIIRIGSAGSYTPKAKIFDVVLATGAYSESNYAVTQSGDTDDIQKPSEELNNALRASAKKQGIPLIEGTIHSSDVFYREDSGARPTYWEVLRDEKGCLAVEMESFALFHNAKVLGKHAACILTISDSFVSPEITTAEERQTSFTAMMKVALGAVLE
mgnify:CR=1 FL=1